MNGLFDQCRSTHAGSLAVQNSTVKAIIDETPTLYGVTNDGKRECVWAGVVELALAKCTWCNTRAAFGPLNPWIVA